jgi:hypothetical protein
MDAFIMRLIEQAQEYLSRDERVPADILAALAAEGIDVSEFN